MMTFLYVAQVRSTLTHALSCCLSDLEVLFIIIIYIILVALPHTPPPPTPPCPTDVNLSPPQLGIKSK